MKNPSFLFYASDFYMDTISWTDEMVGLHIRLMCLQWINGSIESDGDFPANLSEKSKEIFIKIKHKYFKEKNGKFYNKRLRKTQKEKNEFIKNARNAGRKGASARWGKHSVPYGVPHENPNGETMAFHASTSSSVSKEEKEIKEKEIFPFPKDGDLSEDLPEKQNKSAIEIYKLSKNILLSRIQVNRFWGVFKIQHLTGKNYYADVGDVHKHFINWIKGQKVESINQQQETMHQDAHAVIAKNGY